MLKISNLHKTFYKDGTHFTVFENLSLSVREGEFAAFVGPSGCGKSTLLTLIAGLEKQSLGEILHKEKPVTNPHFKRGFVFQNLSLFP
jgi:NitT/TauT family transport system ATP-binding protein